MNLLHMSISGGVLIAVAALLRFCTLNRLPKRTFTALWAVAAVRLLLPLSVPTRLSVYNALPASRDMPVGLLRPAGPVLEEAASLQQGFSWPAVVWGVGCLLCTAYFLTAYIRCRREFRTALPVSCAYVQNFLEVHRLRRRYTVRQSDRISTPLTYGLVRPVILLPQTTAQEETQLPYILTHEYVHIRRFDTAYKFLLAAALCVHWFNPLVWALYCLAGRDLELACDEQVVRLLGRENRAGYARTLIQMEESRPGLSNLYNHFSKTAAQERITSIMKSKKFTFLGAVLALLLVAGITIAFASSPITAPDRLSAQDALADLTDSIQYQNGRLSFQLPEGYPEAENWNIQIAGRMETEGFSSSVHFLEEENAARAWAAGQTYAFDLQLDLFTELTFYAALPNADGSWTERALDLLQQRIQ